MYQQVYVSVSVLSNEMDMCHQFLISNMEGGIDGVSKRKYKLPIELHIVPAIISTFKYIF